MRRFRSCRSLPASILAYASFIMALLLHAKVPVSYDLETTAVAELATGFTDSVSSPASWHAWATDVLLPAVLPAASGDAPPPLLNGYAVAMGGLRFAQARSTTAPCSESPPLVALYNKKCFPPTQLSTAPFGNASLAMATGGPAAAAAFSAGAGRGVEVGGLTLPFELVINTASNPDEGYAQVAGLFDGGWIDGATRTVSTTLVLFNGNTGMWATVRLTADFQRGGRVAVTPAVSSFPADPYAAPPETLTTAGDGDGGAVGSAVPGPFLAFLDLIVVAYFLYLIFGTAKRLWIALTSKGSAWDVTSRAFAFWRLLDFAACSSLLALIISWGQFLNSVTVVRAQLGAENAPGPDTFSGLAHAGTAALVFAASREWSTFKVSGSLALIFLSLRLFKYFQFQPRLAVMTDSLAMAVADGAHFALLFSVLLACYGSWGMFMFGTQAPDWNNPNVSIVSIFRYMMYDYDRDAMMATFPNMANLFFGSFMLIVTNLTLWMFLAIILESYTEVRSNSHGSPSLLDDTRAFFSTLPPVRSWHKYLACGLCGKVPGMETIIKVLTVGSLRSEAVITSAQLRAAVPHLSIKAAEALVTDALTWSFSAAATSGKLPTDDDEEFSPSNAAGVSSAAGGGSGSGVSSSSAGATTGMGGGLSVSGARPVTYSQMRAAITRASSSDSSGQLISATRGNSTSAMYGGATPIGGGFASQPLTAGGVISVQSLKGDAAALAAAAAILPANSTGAQLDALVESALRLSTRIATLRGQQDGAAARLPGAVA